MARNLLARLAATLALASVLACNASPIFVVVQVNPTSVTLYPGAADTLHARATQLGYGVVTNALISWSSQDTSIATVSGVDSVAIVTAVAPGTTAVIAASGSSVGTVPVTVLLPIPGPAASAPIRP